MKYCIIGAAAVMLIAIAGCGKPPIEEGTVVSVVYSTDTRGQIEGCGCKKSGGGITKRAAKVAAAREHDPTVLYLDSGNFLTGSAEADSTNGQVIVAAYNELGASVVNVSERELSRGMDVFENDRKQSNFSYVSANLRYHGNNVAEPYVTRTVKGATVAVVGLCGTRDIMRYDSTKLPDEIEITDPLQAARRVIPPLEGSADIIIVLSTCGDRIDSSLANDFQMITLIIGGRSYRPNSDNPWVIGSTRIVRTERDGRDIGRMDMVFGPDRKIKTFSPSKISIEASDPSSEAMLAVIRKYVPSFVDNPAEGSRGPTAAEANAER